MGLAQLVASSVTKARQAVGDLAIQFSVKRKTGSTYLNGSNFPTYDTKPVYGVHDKFEAHELDGSLVQVTDTKILLFIDTPDQVPTAEDLLVEGSIEYQVRSSQPIYAGDKIVMAIVQARK